MTGRHTPAAAIPPQRRSVRVSRPRPRLRLRGPATTRRRLAWAGAAPGLCVLAVTLCVIAAGLITAAMERPAAAPAPVPLAQTSTPPPPPSRTAPVGVGDGSYDVTDHPISAGSWSAPGGARCAWSVRNAAGSTMLQGSGQARQKVDLRAGLNFRASGCGPWVRA